MKQTIVPLILAASLNHPSMGEIIGETGTYMAPPAMLGFYEMTPFPLDERPLWDWVTDVPSPLGGDIQFSIPLRHFRNGGSGGWKFWGHGYEGDVYSSDQQGDEVTLDLPDGTMAFYFEAHHYLTSWHDIYATVDGETWISDWTSWGGGAVYFGFYQDDPSGPPIDFITVKCPTAGMVAIGEFGIAIPAPGGLALLIGASMIGFRRRRE